jgi:hypothetical protein
MVRFLVLVEDPLNRTEPDHGSTSSGACLFYHVNERRGLEHLASVITIGLKSGALWEILPFCHLCSRSQD